MRAFHSFPFVLAKSLKPNRKYQQSRGARLKRMGFLALLLLMSLFFGVSSAFADATYPSIRFNLLGYDIVDDEQKGILSIQT